MAIVAFLPLLLSLSATLPFSTGEVGSCSLHMYFYKTRISCEIPFFRGLQMGLIHNCSDGFETLTSCIKNVTRECEHGWRSDEWIDFNVRQNIRKQFYCYDGALVLPFVLCGKGYYEKGPQCVKTFHRKLRRNITEPTLCYEFSKAKNCIRELLEKECSLKKNSQEIYSNIIFDGYNPFCVNRVYDPPTTVSTPSRKHRQKVTSPSIKQKTISLKTALSKSKAIFVSSSKLSVIFFNVVYIICCMTFAYDQFLNR